MSLAILEHETTHPQFEISVDSVDDLRMLNTGLTNIIAKERVAQRNFSDNTDEHKLVQAELLRERVAEDFEATKRGTIPEEFRYTVEESGFVIEALEIAKQNEQSGVERKIAYKEIIEPRKVQISTPNHSKTSRFIPQQRITSFNDPRLDEKPRRWFRR